MSDSAETATAAADEPGREPGSRRGSRRVEGEDRSPGRLRSIPLFYRQVVAELRKVIWPTRKELLTYTSVVLVFVVAMTAVVGLFDFGFSQAVLAVFGGDGDPATGGTPPAG